MRLGLILALSRDRRTGRVLSPELLPLDQAMRSVKASVAANDHRDPRFPILAAAGIELHREHVFRFTAAQSAAFVPDVAAEVAPGDEIKAVLAANAEMQAEIEESQAAFADLQSQLQESTDSNARAVAALGEAQSAARASAARIADLEAQLVEASKKTNKSK